MPDPDFLVTVGVKLQDFVAGLAGGIVNALVFQKTNPVAFIGSVVVGALTATYLSEPAARYLGTSGGASAFIMGLCAMAVCQSLVAAVSRWTPPIKGGDSSGGH